MAVTIRDVAKKADVSPGTVSRVLNGSPLVSKATKERVLQAVEEMNYIPNIVARQLSTGKTLTIAVIVPFFTRPSYVERMNGIISVLADSHYDLMIHNAETLEQRDVCFREIPRRERVDGVLILSIPPSKNHIQLLLEANLPIVLIDSYHPDLGGFSQVYIDDVEGGRKATQHLVDLGHRRIGFIGDLIDNPLSFTASYKRFTGYKQVLEAAGIPFRPEYYGEDQHGLQEAKRDSIRMLTLPEPPTAIFAASDTQALGVLKAAEELGISVPEQLSIIGYDDIEIAEYLGLTTIRQMLFESGQRGIELLLKVLEDPSIPAEHEILPTELVERKTTAPPAH
jgi:DNA-binding LacI/PurR family transcriptional regulator